MQYLERLLDRFSDTPKHIVIKADILRRGIKLNDDIQRAGEKSCLTGLLTKFESVISEFSPPPSQFHFKADETTVDIKIDDRSPYEISEDSEDNYYLFCGEENLGEVRFTNRPSYMDKQTSDGKPCADFLTQRGPSCLCVSPIDFCAYFKTGDACKYCAFAPLWEYRVQAKGTKPFPDYNMLAEAVVIACNGAVDLKDPKLNG